MARDNVIPFKRRPPTEPELEAYRLITRHWMEPGAPAIDLSEALRGGLARAGRRFGPATLALPPRLALRFAADCLARHLTPRGLVAVSA
jgi:hypothetical protein